MIIGIRAFVRRMVPTSVRHQIASLRGKKTWYKLGEHVTFKESGFVAATSPALLLARHNYEVAVIHEVLGDSTFDQALEVGCGYGRLSSNISAHANELVSLDINPEGLHLARLYYPHQTFREGSVDALPFEDNAFDLVVSWTVIQHLSHDLFDQAVKEIKRVLRPGGTLLLCEATKFPDVPSTPYTHTWDRDESTYQRVFAPMQLAYSSYIDALDEIGRRTSQPSLASPGRVMLFTGEI